MLFAMTCLLRRVRRPAAIGQCGLGGGPRDGGGHSSLTL